MRITSILLRNFRSYSDLDLQFSPGKNILLGRNGQGKTNLLEAIYFMSHSKSNRTSNDRELMCANASQFTTISAQIESDGYEGTTQLDAFLSIDEEDKLKTLFKANGIPLKNRSQVLGFIPTVSFFLSDLLLLRGTPEDRRKWLDAAISQYDKRHFIYLAEFQRIRQQKSKLLKDPPERISRSVLETLNQQFARLGARLIASRLHYLLLIQDMVTVKYIELAGSQERLAVNYQTSIFPPDTTLESLAQTGSVEMIENCLTQALVQRMPDELRRGTCLVGPHRDDILFTLNSMDATAYGSQGQQRSIVLALKLTELNLLSHKLGETPVLLLDDVMAELDPRRQQCLLDRIEGSNQVFISTTHLDDSLKPLIQRHQQSDTASIYQVCLGSVRSVEQAAVPSYFSMNP
ncbi:MAG: DNA replication/repair protein RecF [Cyanobacteria bacterium]|nr:DNA replication/repair protein RecF [Cyanobacteriota bacterium]